jgi:hypothetical protein
MIDLLRTVAQRADQFSDEAHRILSTHEASSRSRVFSLNQTRRRLATLSIEQEELFQQALICTEVGAYRAAHVMAWAAFIDLLERKLGSDGLVKIHNARPAWSKYTSVEELRENVPEHQLIEAARDVKLLSKSEAKTILGLLSKRNECAHPGDYRPDLNESLGYAAELLNRIQRLLPKSL